VRLASALACEESVCHPERERKKEVPDIDKDRQYRTMARNATKRSDHILARCVQSGAK